MITILFSVVMITKLPVLLINNDIYASCIKYMSANRCQNHVFSILIIYIENLFDYKI